MNIGTQNQAFFPAALEEKFRYLKSAGFDGFEIDGRLLVDNLDQVKAAIAATGIPVTTACGGYRGWIGDFVEHRRLNCVTEIKQILRALSEVGGTGIVVPAAWGMFSLRLPPMISPRTPEGDRKAVGASLKELDTTAKETGTVIFLEPLNRYEDHMINTVADAKQYIEDNDLEHVRVAADIYHMNIEEDDIRAALHDYREWIGHVHLADNHRYQPGSGSLEFREFFSQLKRDGYQGFMTLECRVRGDDPQAEYSKSLAFLRRASA